MRPRPAGAKKVRIINLGFEPAEARDMDLQVERFKRGDKELPVAEHVPSNDRLWLQSNRVELNAMTTPQFLAWLDRKFEPYRGKVIPPDEVLRTHLDGEIREGLTRRFTQAILRRVGLDAIVERALARRSEAIESACETLAQTIRDSFDRDASQPWAAPLRCVARKITRVPNMTRGLRRL